MSFSQARKVLNRAVVADESPRHVVIDPDAEANALVAACLPGCIVPW